MINTLWAVLICCLAAGSSLSQVTSFLQPDMNPPVIPKPDHIVIVVEENRYYSQVMGNSSAPYINSLAAQGAEFTNAYAAQNPSQPNYLNLYSGSNQGVWSDYCPYSFSSGNLGGNLLKAGYTFKGYSESLPSVGYTGCKYNSYVRKHSPWINFTDVPASANVPFTHFPQGKFEELPTVSFVIPNLDNDMHDGTVARGDAWLKKNMDAYVQWAKKNNSLLILTWDEGNIFNNHIPTIFVGRDVQPGKYKYFISHFTILRTIEDMYQLPYLGKSRVLSPIRDIWKK